MTKREARGVAKKAIETFVDLATVATVADVGDLLACWGVVSERFQPQDDDPEECDPYACETGILALAGLDNLPWDADDVTGMLHEGDTAAALAEVDRFRSLAFGPPRKPAADPNFSDIPDDDDKTPANPGYNGLALPLFCYFE